LCADEGLFDLDFLTENLELLVVGRVTELTVHHFKDGLELVCLLSLLDECIDKLEVDIPRVLLYAIFQEDRKEEIPVELVFLCLHLGF